MSRIGKKPITIPKGVTVKVLDKAVEVQGPKGKLRQAHPSGIRFEVSDGHLLARTVSEDPQLGKFHGLARSLIANAVAGVTNGFKRELDIVGVGYRAELKGKQVVFACRSGRRSVTASLAAQDAGLPYDKHLAGGILGWKAAGLLTRAPG